MRITASVLIGLAVLTAAGAQEQEPGTSDPDTLVVPAVIREAFTGDLPQIRERGILRALVNPSRTDFFLEGARPRGILVELLEQFHKHLNKGLKRRQLQVAIKYVVVPFDELIPALLEGRGDIAVANLTITPEREAKVAFVRGKENRVDELLVIHKAVSGITSPQDLSGRTVQVLAGKQLRRAPAAAQRTAGGGRQEARGHRARRPPSRDRGSAGDGECRGHRHHRRR